MSINKVVLKGTGRMSLHERFTQLKFDQKSVQQQQPVQQIARVQSAPRVQPRAHQSVPRPYEYKQRVRSRTPDMPRYDPRRQRSISPAPARFKRSISPARFSRSPAVRNQSAPTRNPYGVRSSTVLAANRIRKKSVYLRLGVRPGSSPRMSSGIPVWAEPYMAPREQIQSWYGHRTGGISRSNSSASLNRWNSQGSLNSFDAPRSPRYQTQRRWGGGGGWRGGRRNNNFGRNRGGNRWSFGGGRGRGGRGRGWGGGRGRGGRRPPPPSREELDKELDSYMAGTKGLLDQEMDEYMANK